MTDLRQLCSHLRIDPEFSWATLESERHSLTSALAMPWYVRLVVGAGAWATAIAAIALGVAAVFLIADEGAFAVLTVLGFAYSGLGLALLRRAQRSLFVVQIAVAVTAAGTAMITAGISIEAEEPWAGFFVSLSLTASIVVLSVNRSLQFLVALLMVVMFVISAAVDTIPWLHALVAAVGVTAAVLLLWPPRRDLRPLAIVLLLVFPVFDWFFGDIAGLVISDQELPSGRAIAKALYIALFLGLAGIHWQRTADHRVRTRLVIFSVAAICVGLLLPPGGAAALTILMVAFVVGSRPLALLGTLIQINYIWRFYYDMEVSLLAKSGILTAVGTVLVLAWWLMMRHKVKGARA